MILIIDNYDSFTYNLYQQIAAMGHTVTVVKHDAIRPAQITAMHPSHIVISPGPKRPQDSGMSNEVIRRFYKTTPLLGVCLGHQCIGEIFGSHTVNAPVIMHGKADAIRHTQSGLFRGLSNPFMAARYNSLVLDAVPNECIRTAWSNDGSIMAIQHERYQLHGVQFHPESFMTPLGDIIMRNFLQCSM